MRIEDELNNKKILIWGYGREGKITKEFLDAHCRCRSIEIFEGDEEDIDDGKYDFIIKSPGIIARRKSSKYISQTEMFLKEFSAQTIGITGTKGKSTTSTLLYHVLASCLSVDVFLVGNIGKAALSIYDDIKKDSVIVFEMSCHQLAGINISPHIAVFLNLYEDHLDYYGNMENYFEAKKHITYFQNEDDYLLVGQSVPEIQTKAKKIIVPFEAKEHLDVNLLGEHNQYNASVVYKICTEIFGCGEDEVKNAMKSFKGLHHRMEYVACVNGVDYYNDSISTIPEATIQALCSIKNAKTVLIGGMDRHIEYDILIDFIKEHGEYNYILSYDSGKRIYEDVADLPYCFYKDDLKESLSLAKEITPEGYACILSPASASYGAFKDFEDRGDTFKNMILSKKDNKNE